MITKTLEQLKEEVENLYQNGRDQGSDGEEAYAQAINDVLALITKMTKDPTCEYGHNCTSRCGNDIECVCYSEHWCSMSPEHDESECADSEEECPQHPKVEDITPDLSAIKKK